MDWEAQQWCTLPLPWMYTSTCQDVLHATCDWQFAPKVAILLLRWHDLPKWQFCCQDGC